MATQNNNVDIDNFKSDIYNYLRTASGFLTVDDALSASNKIAGILMLNYPGCTVPRWRDNEKANAPKRNPHIEAHKVVSTLTPILGEFNSSYECPALVRGQSKTYTVEWVHRSWSASLTLHDQSRKEPAYLEFCMRRHFKGEEYDVFSGTGQTAAELIEDVLEDLEFLGIDPKTGPYKEYLDMVIKLTKLDSISIL